MNQYQKSRFDFKNITNQLVAVTEVLLAAPPNQQLAEAFNGTFDVILKGEFKSTHKDISHYCDAGIVVLHPHDVGQYACLKEFFLIDGGIDLIALRKAKQIPDGVNLPESKPLCDLLEQVFIVLKRDALIPIENLVKETQRSLGHITARKRGLNAACNPRSSVPADVTEVMLRLIEKMEEMHEVLLTKI